MSNKKQKLIKLNLEYMKKKNKYNLLLFVYNNIYINKYIIIFYIY